MSRPKSERGHPIYLFAAILLVAFALLSVGKAVADNGKCDGTPFNGHKHWVVMPPKWVCGEGHVHFTDDS